jgi:hypothetical protein
VGAGGAVLVADADAGDVGAGWGGVKREPLGAGGTGGSIGETPAALVLGGGAGPTEAVSGLSGMAVGESSAADGSSACQRTWAGSEVLA